MRLPLLVILAALSACRVPSAGAGVVWSTNTGFEVRETVHVGTAPAKAFDAFTVDVGRWWNDEHTWSGSARNLSMQPVAGGCFCEKLADGGGVEHLRVVFVRPGAVLSMAGGLGPLQAMAFEGVLRVTFAAQSAGTDVTLTYRVHGSDPKGAEPLAPMVDAMLSETMKRYQRFLDTGSPNAKH